jgi:hypothetical protein
LVFRPRAFSFSTNYCLRTTTWFSASLGAENPLSIDIWARKGVQLTVGHHVQTGSGSHRIQRRMAMANVVVEGSNVSASQLKDFFRKIEDGSINRQELQAFLEDEILSTLDC